MSEDAFKGVVEAGRGLGVSRMANPDILDRIESYFGFRVTPGTLNVRFDEPLERKLLTGYLAGDEIDGIWAAETGQAGYFWSEARIAERYRAIVFQADEADYPPDLAEVMCEVHLRGALGLSDGDSIRISLIQP